MDPKPLLQLMVDKGGSDLYLSPGTPPSMKLDGTLTRIGNQALQPQDTENLVHAVLTEKQKGQFQEALELNLALSYPGLGRFRVNVFRQRGSIGFVIRRVSEAIPSFDALRLPPQVGSIIESPRGMILVVGAAASGKSTTLAAMIDYRNATYADHIITVEDPIEYVHQHKQSVVNQRELGMDTLSWESALENTLRQAPDVILVGEIRNAEVMEQVLAFADTGHLVLSTLHANSADQTLERIVNFFSEERHKQTLMDLSLNLQAVISQRLIPRADAQGRIAAVEILINTPTMADAIANGKLSGVKEIMEASRQQGMQTFDQALIDLHNAGEITVEEAQAHADSINNVRLATKMAKLEKGEVTPSEPNYQIEETEAEWKPYGSRRF